jgi:hypothetical protein
MNDENKPHRFGNARAARDPVEETAELFPGPRPELHRRREKSDDQRPPPAPSVYLWLCCEGWMRFGPFVWLRFDDKENAIIDPDGEVVARKTGEYWRVTGGRGEGMAFSDPTLTTTREHPHKNSGSHPK